MPGDHIVGVYYPWLDYKWPGFPAGVPVKNPLLADVPSLFYPLKIFSMGLFRSGKFPTWNPMIFNGYPLLATFQSGVLNPFNLYFMFFSNPVAWTLYIATQPLLALLFMYFFLRTLGIRKIASVLGAVVYAFCGFNLLWLEYGIHGYVAAYIPLLFLLVGRRRWLMAAVVLAAQLFAGYPQISLYTIIFLGFWVLWGRTRITFAPLYKYILTVLLGLGLAGLLLVPGFELFSRSQRVGESLAGGSKSGAFYPVSQLITLIAPDYFGNPSTYNVWGGVQYTNNTGYASAVALVLGLLALVLSRRRDKYFFAGLYLLPVFLSLPTPASFFIQKLPVFSASVMTRIMVFSGFSLAVLAAAGTDVLSRSVAFRFSQLKYLLLPLFIIVGFAWAADVRTGPEKIIALRNLFFPTIFVITAYFSVFLITMVPKLKNIVLVLLVLEVTAELFRFGWKYNVFFPDRLIFPPTKITDYLKAHPGYRLDGGDVLPLSVWMAYGLKSGSGYDAVYPGLWSRYESALDYGSIYRPKGRFNDVTNYASPLFDIAGNGYILALNRRPDGLPDPAGVPYPRFSLPKFEQVFAYKTVRVYRNLQALPEFSLITGYEVIKGEDNIISRLQDPRFDSKRLVVLEENPGVKLAGTTNNGSLKLLSDIPGNQLFAVDLPAPAILLNTQEDYPGWQAVVDGNPVQIYRADYAFQAVILPSGSHRVEFTYEPDSIKIGASVSIISLMTIFGLSKFFRRQAA